MRPKGYIKKWNPQEKTRIVLSQVEEVLETYREHLPLSIRQIFYRLVGVYGYGKTENDYNNLLEYMNRARRSRMIPFSSIRDDGWNQKNHSCWDDPDHVWSAFQNTAEGYVKNKMVNQHYNIYLLCEAAGMVPQMVRVARPYSVPVMSSGGFDSLTVKYDLALKIKNNGKPTIFLHVGDYDPSGQSIYDSLAADVIAFTDEMLQSTGWAIFERVALTPGQIADYSLPTKPAKSTDKRNNNIKDTCQAEALPPDILASIVEAAIKDKYDITILEDDLRAEVAERKELLNRLDLQ